MEKEKVLERDPQIQVLEAKPKLKEPALYEVIIHNDDYTPMDFVVEVLETFFSMEKAQAESLMFQIHTAGKAGCGIYSRDVADTKVEQVMEYARTYDHPLMCSIEAIDRV